MRAYTDLFPGFAEDVFHRGEEGLGILLSASGGGIVICAICAQTLVQSSVEPEFRGRVIAVYLSLAPSAQAVGSFAVGWLAEFTSLPSAVAAGAVGLLR